MAKTPTPTPINADTVKRINKSVAEIVRAETIATETFSKSVLPSVAELVKQQKFLRSQHSKFSPKFYAGTELDKKGPDGKADPTMAILKRVINKAEEIGIEEFVAFCTKTNVISLESFLGKWKRAPENKKAGVPRAAPRKPEAENPIDLDKDIDDLCAKHEIGRDELIEYMASQAGYKNVHTDVREEATRKVGTG